MSTVTASTTPTTQVSRSQVESLSNLNYKSQKLIFPDDCVGKGEIGKCKFLYNSPPFLPPSPLLKSVLYVKLLFFSDHVMALSFSDLSVWCYCCDNYVDNEKLYTIKNAAHRDKFGEEMIKVGASEGTVDINMI